MWGTTPPCEMTTSPRSLFNSSSLRIASWRWRGTILGDDTHDESAHVRWPQRGTIDGWDSPPNQNIIKNKIVNSPLFLVITGSIASELEDLGREVFEYRSEVNGRACTDTLGVVASLEHTMDTTDGELETGF